MMQEAAHPQAGLLRKDYLHFSMGIQRPCQLAGGLKTHDLS